MRAFLRHPAAPALGGFLALAAAIGIGRFAYTPILPYMVEELGLDRSRAGLVASANFLGYFVGALAAAAAPPGGRRHWLAWALALNALAIGAMAAGASTPLFLLLRFAGGAASALAMVFASALVLDRLAAMRRPEWAALLYAGVGGGIAVSALAVPAVALRGGDWRGPWLACSAAAAVLSLAAVWLVREDAHPPPFGPVRRAAPAADGGARLRRFVLAYGLFGFGYAVTATFVSDMARADPALRPAENAVWLCVGLAAMPSVAPWVWAGRRWGNDRAFAAACLVEAAGVALGGLAGGAASLLLAAGLLGGTFVGVTALGLVNARLLSPADPRRAIALATASFGLGQMAAPAFAGALRDALGGYAVPSLLAAAALSAAATLAIAAAPPGRTATRGG